MEKTNPRKRNKLTTSLTLLLEDKERVEELARLRQWTVAQTSGFLVKLGLEKLGEIGDQQPAQQSKATTN